MAVRYLFLSLLIVSVLNATSLHVLQLEEGPLSYQATVDSLPIFIEEKQVGQMSYISYVKESSIDRPITFVFNGGPGSSSVWLHMGAFGPRRIKSFEEGQSMNPPYEIVDNLETILDVTDLVFIDPMGTGLSTKCCEETKPLFDIVKDYESIGQLIRDYLTVQQRWNSPKYIAGESYGVFRSCGLAAYLQNNLGIFLNGLILISGVIDYQTLECDQDNLLPFIFFLPTYATTAWYHHRSHQDRSIEEVASLARKFAYGTYLNALFCPSYLNEHQKRDLYEEISAFTGISYQTVQHRQGKFGNHSFLSDFFGDDQRLLGRLDTRFSGYCSDPNGFIKEDPSLASPMGSFTAAFHDYLARELECPKTYQIMSSEVYRHWKFDTYNEVGYPNLMKGLRQALVTNPQLKIYIGCGYFDCATPFAAMEYSIDHLNLPDPLRANIQLEYYQGGHMYYFNPTERVKFKQDLIRFYDCQERVRQPSGMTLEES
jgi:carboxypeptidase C (cathepsin A)